jgi:hypothetical protein
MGGAHCPDPCHHPHQLLFAAQKLFKKKPENRFKNRSRERITKKSKARARRKTAANLTRLEVLTDGSIFFFTLGFPTDPRGQQRGGG